MKHIFKKKNANQKYRDLDRPYLEYDKSKILRTNNLDSIPNATLRRGGKISYAEWAHVIGLFQSLLYFNLESYKGNKILDIGCGTGLLAMASMPFITENGKYLGLDVKKNNIVFCNSNYKHPNVHFEHFDISNEKYAANQSKSIVPWDVTDGSYDVITALSVWTHLNEEHSIFYFKEIDRVLKKGGKAIISFFYLDDDYQKSLERRTDDNGRFHKTKQKRWIFSENAYESKDWFCPEWVKVPEDAIGVNSKAIEMMIADTSLEIENIYSGNWKENPGFYFQDVIIFTKK